MPKDLEYTVEEYGKLKKKNGQRDYPDQKRLGGTGNQNAINALVEGQTAESFWNIIEITTTNGMENCWRKGPYGK